MSLKHFTIFDEDDDDPMLSSINLVDVFLVLVVALMAAVNITTRTDSAANDGKLEIVVREQGQEIRYQGSGSASEGEGIRAGVAYRLRDGSIIYVPEGETAPRTTRP